MTVRLEELLAAAESRATAQADGSGCVWDVLARDVLTLLPLARANAERKTRRLDALLVRLPSDELEQAHREAVRLRAALTDIAETAEGCVERMREVGEQANGAGMDEEAA